MKIRLETHLNKEDRSLPGTPWWSRMIAVPLGLVVAVMVVTVALCGWVVFLSSHSDSATSSGPQAPPSATFVKTDTTTQGAWKGVYGSGGYGVAEDRYKFAAFAHIGLPDKQHSSIWIDQVDEIRALQKPKGTKRIASTWFAWTPFTIDVNLTDDKTHRLAVYVVDWDSGARIENFEIVDGITQKLLDSRQVSKFSEGEYLVWRVSGHIIVRITPVAGANAVASGIFID